MKVGHYEDVNLFLTLKMLRVSREMCRYWEMIEKEGREQVGVYQRLLLEASSLPDRGRLRHGTSTIMKIVLFRGQ